MSKTEVLKEFQNKMTLRVNILRDVSMNYNYSKHLFMNFNSTEIGNHWGFIRHNLFKILIIDLAKLFVSSENQKVNFFKLMDQLETGKYKILKFDKKTIEIYRIKLRRHRKNFIEIHHLRDKLFAHTEIHAGVAPLNIFFIQTEDLINLAFEILNDISQKINGTSVINIIHLTDLTDFKVL